MRILIPLFSKGRGGLEMYALNLAEEMIERGHEVRLLAQEDSFTARQRTKKGIPGSTLNVRAYIDLIALWNMYDLVDEFEPDIIHVHKSQDIWYGAYLKWLSGAFKLFFTQHMRPGEKNDWLHTLIYGALDRFIVISDDVGEAVRKNCPIGEEKIEKLYYGIDVDEFDVNSSRNHQSKNSEESNESPLRVGLVGRIDPVKRQDLFLEAANRLVNTYQEDVKFWIIGDTVDEKDEDYKQELIKYIEDNQLGDDVEFLGHVDDVQSVYRQLDVNCMTTDREHFGKVLQESQAMEVPVVSSAGGGAPEAINPGVTGLFFEPGNPGDLADKIGQLLEDPSMRRDMASRSREYVKNKFSYVDHFDALESLYCESLSA